MNVEHLVLIAAALTSSALHADTWTPKASFGGGRTHTHITMTTP